jgi:hypothetical protein
MSKSCQINYSDRVAIDLREEKSYGSCHMRPELRLKVKDAFLWRSRLKRNERYRITLNKTHQKRTKEI